MKTREERELIPVTSYDQVPEGMTEDEVHELWSTHEFTEEYIASAPPVAEDDLPPIGPPPKWRPVHLRREVFDKARRLARARGVTINDLIDALVTQALSAEEQPVCATGS